MRFMHSLRIVLTTLCLLPIYQTVLAQDATPAELSYAEKPLVIIRFTEQVVPYENALSRAVSQAENQMDTPFYDVVSVYPVDDSYFSEEEKSASMKAKMVVNAMMQAGVQESRIRLSNQPSDVASFEEVHVFVR